MSSLADLSDLIGFFSYSREDDEGSHGALSALRERIQHELRAQLGRSFKTFRLWQDKEAIAAGTLWEVEIKTAVGQSVFFIPIITPTVVKSPYCLFELNSFLAREADLGRSDLVFPILYITVPSLNDADEVRADPALSLIAKRQYVDWRDLRHHDANSREVKQAVERFCAQVSDALRRRWLTPEERKAQDEATALQKAEAERKQREEETTRREEEARRKAAEAQARERAEQDRLQREAEAERKRAKEQHVRDEAEAKRRAEKDEPVPAAPPVSGPAWRPSRPVLLIASLVGGVVLVAIGMWVVFPPSSAPVTPAPASDTPLSPTQERALKPKDTFKECANCPQMIVVPAGSFSMGSSASDPNRRPDEGPQHTVTFAQRFAVGQFELTFAEWDACTGGGGCSSYTPSDATWGRGRRPVINVSWQNAKAYLAWLSAKTDGKTYRLLTEAEYEYATRAGTTTAYPWGNAIGKNHANCNGCGSQWDNKETAPVGLFEPNQFGLYDMVGNVWAFVEDCYHENYDGAPTDGSAWNSGECSHGPVTRGGAWTNSGPSLRSAMRGWQAIGYGGPTSIVGLRVARTLLTP